MRIRQRPEGTATKTYPVFEGSCTVVSVITEDNGVPNDDGIILVAKGKDTKGEVRTYRVSLDKVESRRIYDQVARAMAKNGPNFVKDSIDG